jgi:hypothetical protein
MEQTLFRDDCPALPWQINVGVFRREESGKLSENDKEDLCRRALCDDDPPHWRNSALYSVADGQLCQMVVRDPEEEIVSISICDEQDFGKVYFDN